MSGNQIFGAERNVHRLHRFCRGDYKRKRAYTKIMVQAPSALGVEQATVS